MMSDEEIDPMGWRLSGSVVRGEIDSRVRDRVTGRLWLVDRQFPIELNLKGNPLRDLAGCLLTFENPEPEPEDNEGLCPVQMGRTGSITASRKIQICEVPSQAIEEMQRRGEPIKRQVSNSLYIEWYSNANGRVILESATFSMTISDYAWRMRPDGEAGQLQQNREAFERWTDIVAAENSDEDFDDDESMPDWYMDEFDWEKQLQESDAMTERYMQLIEAFLDHPERDRLIAHEMGWNGLQDAFDEEDFDADELSPGDEFLFDEDPFPDEDMHPLDPIPESEGKDWIKGRDGKVRHPLTERAAVLATAIWRCCKEHHLTGDAGQGQDPDVHNLLFHTQTLNAKLSGALDGLAYDDDPDGGFVVACLKRALRHFGLAINAASIIVQKNLLPAVSMQSFRDEFFAIRQDILSLMKHFRQIN